MNTVSDHVQCRRSLQSQSSTLMEVPAVTSVMCVPVGAGTLLAHLGYIQYLQRHVSLRRLCNAADEDGPEAERLRLYDIQWLDEPSIAQARVGEEHLIRRQAGLSEDALSGWITKHADVEAIQAGLPCLPSKLHRSTTLD